MRKELKYFLAVVSIFSLSVYFLLLLLKKYATLTFEHFLQTCKVAASGFFSSGAHYLGFVLAAFVLIVTLGLFLKTLFSYTKTKKKLAALLQKEIYSLPKKLENVLRLNNIGPKQIIVVEDNRNYALTLDWFSPRMVISSNLVTSLSETQLEAVVLHEYCHLKNRHPLLLVVGEILASSLSLLPILKDLTKKLRSAVEQEADAFVVDRQNTDKHLNFALNLAAYASRFKIFPSFSRRNDYTYRKSSLLISFLFFLNAIILFKFPADIHATRGLGELDRANCGENICSTHCPTGDINRQTYISSAFQTTLVSSSGDVD